MCVPERSFMNQAGCVVRAEGSSSEDSPRGWGGGFGLEDGILRFKTDGETDSLSVLPCILDKELCWCLLLGEGKQC